MNENGQFLLYDALLSLLLIFIVIIAMFYVLNQEEDFMPNNNEVTDRLNILSSYSVNGKNILLKVEENDSISKKTVTDILSDKEYILDDLTTNQTILSNYSTNHKNRISAKKVIEEHEFRLTFCS